MEYAATEEPHSAARQRANILREFAHHIEDEDDTGFEAIAVGLSLSTTTLLKLHEYLLATRSV